MDSGYIKFWRSAEGSRVWSRGAVHRGVLLTILLKVAWKDSYYRGENLKAGQFAFSGEYLASECMVSRTTLLAILDDLERDGFLTRRNVGNRYTLITITNWARYQSSDAVGCKAGCSAAEQPPEQPDGQPALQQPDTIKEYKKARKEELSAASPDAGVSGRAFPGTGGRGGTGCFPGTSDGGRMTVRPPEDSSQAQPVAVRPSQRVRNGLEDGQAFYVSARGRRLEGRVLAGFEAFWDAYGYRKGKADAADMWLSATHGKPELVPAIVRAARAAAAEYEELSARVKGRVRMYAENWLQGRRWEDSPSPEDDRNSNLSPEKSGTSAKVVAASGSDGDRNALLPAAPPSAPEAAFPSPGTPAWKRLHAIPPSHREPVPCEANEAEEQSRSAGAAVLAMFWRKRGGTIPKFLADMIDRMGDVGGVACLA